MAMSISEIAKQFDLGNIKGDDTWDIETRDLVRLYKNLQRALSDKVALEAKVASLEIQVAFRNKGKAIYG